MDAAIKCLVKEESSIEALSKAKAEILGRVLGMAGDRFNDEPERIADTSTRSRWDWEAY